MSLFEVTDPEGADLTVTAMVVAPTSGTFVADPADADMIVTVTFDGADDSTIEVEVTPTDSLAVTASPETADVEFVVTASQDVLQVGGIEVVLVGGAPRAVTFQYNVTETDKVESVTYTDNAAIVDFIYDLVETDRVSQVINNDSGTTYDFTYDGSGRLTGVTPS